jgi:DNA-binding LacI/PurR family transcriptional regulator
VIIRRGSDTPLVVQVASAIEDIIESRGVGRDEAIPPERVLASSLGVSRTTVRAAIRLLIDRHKLYRVPGSGTYVRPIAEVAVGHAPSHPANRIVAFSTLELSNPWFVELARGVQAALRKQNLSCLFNISDYDLAEEHRFLEQVCRERLVSGVLIAPLQYKNQSMRVYDQLREAKIPFVFVSHNIAEIDADYVVADGHAGSYEAISYLVRLGHRNIGYVSCNTYADGTISVVRMQGYLQALHEHGLTPMPTSQFVNVKQDFAAGYRAMGELFDLTPRPTAVLAFNDSMAIGAYRRAHEAGLRVPEDLSIIGIDNTEMAATWEVPLTSVDPSPDVVGHHAVNALLHRIEHPEDERYQRIAIRSNLVVRSSCGPPPT